MARCMEPVIFSAYRMAYAAHVARSAAHGLDERTLGAQEAFLVRIQDRHQGHFRQVQAFAQEVDAHQHVEHAQAQVADDLGALHGLDVRVQVTHFHTVFGEVLGQSLPPCAW